MINSDPKDTTYDDEILFTEENYEPRSSDTGDPGLQEPDHGANGKADDERQPSTEKLLKSSAAFIAELVPPDYVIDGVIQRRFAYSLCAKTGAGKTAIMLFLAACIALGKPLGNREVAKGKVIFFAGENPTDVQMRWLALSISMGFDVNTINVAFVDGFVKLSAILNRLKTEIEASSETVVAVFIDTKAAYFEGKDEDDNTQARDDAQRHRSLTELPGGPSVIVACHPPKNPPEGVLIPRGGGAYVGEMDGNLTAKMLNDVLTELHWQTKFRGIDFAPLTFQITTVRLNHPQLKDTKGRILPSVIAGHVSDQEQERLVGVSDENDIKLLTLIADDGTLSAREMAVRLDWKMANGDPYKVMVQRTLKRLSTEKLVAKEGKRHRLTAPGFRAIGRKPAYSRRANGPDDQPAPLHATYEVQPPDTLCAKCGQSQNPAKGPVYRIKPGGGRKSEILHHGECETAWFGPPQNP
jgi:hypothetical protein